MILKATLFTLLVLLVLVVATSYYVNKEAFEDITDKALSSAVSTVAPTEVVPEKPAILPGVEQSSTVPQREDVVPEVSISGSGYDAMNLKQKMDLLNYIQKVVRNEVLAGRNTQPIVSGERNESKLTDTTAQGRKNEESR